VDATPAVPATPVVSATPIAAATPVVAAIPAVPATPGELTSPRTPAQFDHEAFAPRPDTSSAGPAPNKPSDPVPSTSAATSATPAAPALAAPAPKPENRRKHARMKVTYKACVRRSGFPDDVVTCEDMSKGGICFKSRKRYYTDVEIEVAVPYAPGGNAIFVPAKVAWVVELPSERSFKCGVAYRMATRPS
jgi:hypothetical protein